MQAFYWEMREEEYAENYPEEDNLWKLLTQRAEELAEVGITALWLPPANKGAVGTDDVGYGTYDLWDLGEFDQKGTVRTKYGTKEELEQALSALHDEGLEVYYDAVLNHRMGADDSELVVVKTGELAEVWTLFTFPGRDKYSGFVWQWYCFDGIDWDDLHEKAGKFLFQDKEWDKSFGEDYLMGADIDYDNECVREEVKRWANWIVTDIGFDGFRLDASQHVDNEFIAELIGYLQEQRNQELFFGGEAWLEDPEQLAGYLEAVGQPQLKVFDFPLRRTFARMRDGKLDFRWLGGKGLVNKPGYEERAVTFVDNHDTARDTEDKSISRFKYQAYTYILMREHGVPCVFWKDYYQWGMKEGLDQLMLARQKFAYGSGYECESNDYNTYSYMRAGSDEQPNSGLVMMITQQAGSGLINKWINARQPETTFYDYTGHVEEEVTTNQDGWGEFKVKSGAAEGWSVWVPKKMENDK